MPDRWGQGGDYSQTFAYLAQSAMSDLERKAELANDRRESEQAARDSEVFAKYEAGKISDSALLAYIRTRISQTGYDKEQQAKWREALLQYTESINDARAAKEFARSRDYNGYIEYLRTKSSGMSGNAVKKAQIEQQIQDLIDQRDQSALTRGADSINLKIARGKATNKDLLEFYRSRVGGLRDSSFKESVRQTIADLTKQVRAENLQTSLNRLQARYSDPSTKMSAHEYGVAMKRIINGSGLDKTDPGAYANLMEQANGFIRTVEDTGRLEEIAGKLERGDITAQRAMVLMYAEAERYKVYDPKTYQAIRNEAWRVGHTPVAGQTPLPNPGALGTQGRSEDNGLSGIGNIVQNIRNAVKFISQLDGTEYGQVNCVYTSAAMLAYAMGYRDKGGGAITGGDLRYLSGDRSIGTNLDEAEAVLSKLGIGDLRNWRDRGMDFEKFKKRVGEHGQPAVLMGVYANLPVNLRPNPGLSKGHGMFIAAYDAKKKAFLVYDPAVSRRSNPNYKGVWMDENAIKNFGWGPSYTDEDGKTYSFSGQVLLAPPGTLPTGAAAANIQGRGTKLKFVSVDDAPVRPDTPKNGNFQGYRARGHQSVESGPLNPARDQKGRTKAGKPAKIDASIDTVEEVKGELNRHTKRLELISEISDSYNKGETRHGDITLTPELMQKLDQETMDIFDQDNLFIDALTDPETGEMPDWAARIADSRAQGRTLFIAGTQARNSLDAAVIVNSVVRDSLGVFKRAVDDPDPNKAEEAAKAILGGLHVISGVLKGKGQQTETPLDDLYPEAKLPKELGGGDVMGSVPDIDSIIALFEAVAQPSDVPMSDRIGDIIGLQQAVGAVPDEYEVPEPTPQDPNPQPILKKPGNDLGNLSDMILQQRDAADRIARGEAVPVIDGMTGKLGLAPVISKVDPYTGQTVTVPAAEGLIEVPFETPTGVETRLVKVGQAQVGTSLTWTGKDVTDRGYVKNVPLTGAQLAALSPTELEQMIRSGQLVENPIVINQATLPAQRVNGKLVPGKTFFQDPGSGNWWTGDIPVANFGDRNPFRPEFMGVAEDGNPEWEWRAHSTAGMTPLPYQGSRKAIQDAADMGLIQIPTTLARGSDGSVTAPDELNAPRFNSPYDPLSGATTTGVQQDTDPDRLDRILDSVQRARDLIEQRQYDYNLTGFGIYDEGQQQPDKPSYDPLAGAITPDPWMPTVAGRPGVPGRNVFPQQQPDKPEAGFSPPPNPFDPANQSRRDGGLAGLDVLSGIAKAVGITIKPPQKSFSVPKPESVGLRTSISGSSYTPPKPKTAQNSRGQSESKNAPRQVVVGGTVINVQGGKGTPANKPKFTPPPPATESKGYTSSMPAKPTGQGTFIPGGGGRFQRL